MIRRPKRPKSSEGFWSKTLNFERISVNCCGKMMAFVRSFVSKSKRRFRENGFDLDLSYITPRTIVMGFPAEGKEGLFRNPLQEVLRFLTTYHDMQFKIINLCAERDYDPRKLGGNVERIPFEDHQPGPLNVILQFFQIAVLASNAASGADKRWASGSSGNMNMIVTEGDRFGSVWTVDQRFLHLSL